MINNILFDLGKVLIDYDWSILSDKLNWTIQGKDLNDSTEILLQFDAGQLTAREFYEQLCFRFDLGLPFAEFTEAWCNIFWEIPEMIDLASELKKNYRIFIFSNTDELHFPYIWNKFPALHFFENNLMLSYELGAVKPQRRSYVRALEKFDLLAQECLFIDDKTENVGAAEKLGIKSIVHKQYSSTRQELAEYDVI